MTSLLVAIFVASVVGSLHCVGMCGAFMALATTNAGLTRRGATPTPLTVNRALRATLRDRVVRHAGYHAGRLFTYAALGATAGTVGALVDVGGAIVGVQRFGVLCAGAAMMCIGVIALARRSGFWRVRQHIPPGNQAAPPKPTQTGLIRARIIMMQQRLFAWHEPGLLRAAARAAATGSLTTLLPCGWLYAFVIVAAGTGRWWSGAVAMIAFWLGTLPALVGLGALGAGLARVVSMRAKARFMLAGYATLIVVGGLTLAGRLTLAQDALTQLASLAHVSKAHAKITALQRAEALARGQVPACHPGRSALAPATGAAP